MTSTLLEAAAPVVQCKETLQAAAQVNLILAFHRLPDGVVAEVFQGDFIRRKLGCLHLGAQVRVDLIEILLEDIEDRRPRLMYCRPRVCQTARAVDLAVVSGGCRGCTPWIRRDRPHEPALHRADNNTQYC